MPLLKLFGKEIVVKNCYSEVQVKYKLSTYCEKKYGREFDFIIFKFITEEGFDSLFNDIFGDKAINNLFGNKITKI